MGNMIGCFNRQKKSSVSRSRRQGIDRKPSSWKNKYALILATFTSLTQRKDKSKITMAQIKLHGSPLSTATQRVLVCLHEKGLEFDFEIVDLKSGAHKQEPFISMNPFGQVPAFVDGDLHLFESRAITKYIAEAYAEKGTPLLAEDIKRKAATQVWAEVEAHQFDPAASKLAWELLYKPLFGLTTDAAAVEENEAKLSKVLDVYESKLSKTKYLAGESYTLADMHHIPTVQCVLKTSAKKLFESRPLVSAWVADITARPAWAKVVAS